MTEEPPIVEEPPPDNTAGIAWTQVRTGGGLQSPAGTTGELIRSVAWGGGRFVAVGFGGTIVHSTDGATWTAASATATEEDLAGVAWGRGRFVAVAFSGTVVHSADGMSWESASEAATNGGQLYTVTYGGDRFPRGRARWHDRPQRRWGSLGGGERKRFASDRLLGVARSDTRFVAVGRKGDDPQILHSADGTTWTEVSATAASDLLIGVAWSGTRFVAVGRGGTIVHSADGLTWEAASATATEAFLVGVAWGGTRFVAVGEDGTIVSSPDGTTWTEASANRHGRVA